MNMLALLVSTALAVSVRDGCPQSVFRNELSSAQMSGIGCIVSSPPFPIRIFFVTDESFSSKDEWIGFNV